MATPTPSATLDATPLANGDCEALLDGGQLAADLSASTAYLLAYPELAPGVVGGISCEYVFGEQGASDSAQVIVEVVPVAVASTDTVQGSLVATQCDAGCQKTAIAGDWWYTLRTYSTSATIPGPGFEAIATSLESVLAAAAAPAVTTVTPIDCGSAASGTRPYEPSPVSAMTAAAIQASGVVTCLFDGEGGEWEVQVYPSAASIFHQCTQPRSVEALSNAPLGIPGVATASERFWEGYSLGLCASDGTSLAAVSYFFAGEDVAPVWSPEILASAGTILVPLFSAAQG